METPQRIDSHVHVGLVGDRWPDMGGLSTWYRSQLVFKIFLLYARIDPHKVCDTVLHESSVRTLSTCGLDKVVCLALDPVYDYGGGERKDASHVWISNEYVRKLQKDVGANVLFGASVHPYDPKFRERVKACVNQGAVLLKWLPSAQQIDLADTRVRDAMQFLAKVNHGKALPLLLHIGPEYAIPTSDEKTTSYDFLSWSWGERLWNSMRGKKAWHTPRVSEIRQNIHSALDAGAFIIFAHCGLPYFTSGFLGQILEHSDFDVVAEYLQRNRSASYNGRCYADASACCTPFRQPYFRDIAKLPPEYLLFGSDFPTPAFELFADARELKRDFKAIMDGHFERIVIPQGNLLDVNYRELRHAFPGHPMFTNFSRLL